MSILTNFLGLNPSGPTATKKKTPTSLQRLSLSELSNRIKDLNIAGGIDFLDIKSGKKSLLDTLSGTEPDTGQDTGLTGLKPRRDKSSLDLTPEQIRAKQQKDIAGRLTTLGNQRRKLISRVTGARTQRASNISTLLTRGI